MHERGKITNKDRASQLNDFSGLVRHRRITPTDIDGMIDYYGNAFLFFEGKLDGAEFKTGQRIALEHICDAIESAGKPAWCLLYGHSTDASEDVDVANCYVTARYNSGTWTNYDVHKYTVIQHIELFENYCVSKRIPI